MACSPGGSNLAIRRSIAAAILWAVTALSAYAQSRLSLQELGERDPAAGYVPVHLGRRVVVQGVVNSRVHRFAGFQILAIEQGEYGAVLYAGPDSTRFARFQPGDEIRVTGIVALVDGLGVVQPDDIVSVGRRPSPAPKLLSARELSGFRHLGRLVRTEGRISALNDTSTGSYIRLDLPSRLGVFLPRTNQPRSLSGGLDEGESIQVTGIAYQSCPEPPFNRLFHVLVDDPSAVVHAPRNWIVQPSALVAALGGVMLALFLIWNRERRLNSQRELLRKTYQLGEEILSSSSTEAILKRLSESLPGILGITQARLYVSNRSAKGLDAVGGENQETVTISLSSPPGGPHSGAVACFHYRTLVLIPDIARSPFPIATGEPCPKSMMFVPMMAQGEVLGVLELDQDDRARDFTADEQELAQHLANQVAVAVRLQDQRLVREQLFRTEKMAAVGRLISGVVNELQAPLSSISDLAGRALERARGGPAERDVLTLAAEARKAAGMVARLVSFAAAEQPEARQVSLTALLRNLIEFREGDRKASGIRVRDLTTPEPMWTLGSQGQLEQVFLNLLVHAEQSLAQAPEKVITVRTSVLGKRLLAEIIFSAAADSHKAEGTAAVLGVTRSVIAGHGGELRLIEKANTEPRFEVELPAATRDRNAAPALSAGTRPPDSGRRLTALVIEPDEAAQRHILALLSARNSRVVPVNNSDTGLELAHRLRFDVAFCSVHAPGLNWVELSERMHSRVGAFVLVSDGYDTELSSNFEGEGCFVLPKPFQEAELERILRAVESAGHAMRHGAA